MNNINDLLKDAFNSAPEKADSFQELKKANNEAPKKGASYFDQKQFYSRSDLLRIEKPDVKPYQPAFRMGSIIDAFLTEPEQWIVQYRSNCTDFELLQLLRLKHALKKSMLIPAEYWQYHDAIMKGLQASQPKSITTQHAFYRQKFEAVSGQFIPVRIKTDFEIGRHIVDIKSTTKTTFLEFMKDIEHHQLDMQAAFYSDVAKAEKFTLLVLPYQNPNHIKKAIQGSLKDIQQAINLPDVWTYTFSPEHLQRGRDKYQSIVRKGIESGKIRTK